MSCSCEYGKCTGGTNCPVRQARELPEQAPRYTQHPSPSVNLHRVANWLIAILVVCLYAFVQSRDDTYERHAAAASDAQAQAMREMRKDIAAAKMCRETHGESLVRWTVDGMAVCIPRKSIATK